jgi:hypothetical protein
MNLGDLGVCYHDEGEVSERLNAVCEPGGEYGEGEIGRVEEGAG